MVAWWHGGMANVSGRSRGFAELRDGLHEARALCTDNEVQRYHIIIIYMYNKQ